MRANTKFEVSPIVKNYIEQEEAKMLKSNGLPSPKLKQTNKEDDQKGGRP